MDTEEFMSEDYPYRYKGYPAGLEYPWIFQMPSERERDRRWHAIRRAMRKHRLDCLIVSAPFGYMPTNKHLYYISNYVPFANKGTYVVFPLEKEPLLAVSTVLGPQFLHCASETSWIKEITASLSPDQDAVRKIRDLKLESGRIGIVGYGSGVFQASVYDTLRESFPMVTFEDATPVMGEAMDEVSRTSEEELSLLKKACEILDLSYEAVAAALKPGVKEYELWAAAEQAIIKNGGWYPHFMLATSGPRPTFPRAPASHNILNPGDVVIFEIDVNYGGVTSQICYALSLGPPQREIEEMFEFCKELYHLSLTELGKHRTFMDIETDLVSRIHDAGYEPMTPQIHMYNMSVAMPMSSPPQPGDYFTVHPNVCSKDYTAGAKFGDTVRITKEGKVERLQTTQAKLNII
jgi:Xaa-Pro dipeptidase